MASKLIPENSYIDLLIAIYKTSEYDRNKAELIFHYIHYHLTVEFFDPILSQRLVTDLKLDEKVYRKSIDIDHIRDKIDKTFSFYEQVTIKAHCLNIINRSYVK